MIQVPLHSFPFLHYQQPVSQEYMTLMPVPLSSGSCIFLPGSNKIQDNLKLLLKHGSLMQYDWISNHARLMRLLLQNQLIKI